jgi:peptidoglycan/xylan/chitin deacetylase (PgdA/CDA1 family)
MKTPTVYVPGEARVPRILAYHEVSSQFHLGINAVSPRRFSDHIEFLQAEGYHFVPLRGLSEFVPERSLCLTFDDGYASFFDHVLPVLAERQIPATLFVITGYVGRENDWDITLGVNRRDHLSWKRIKEIAQAGIEIGSHTDSHRDLTRLSGAEMERELRGSRREIEDHLEREVTSLALPFGAANLEIFALARQAGYREICGGAPGLRGSFAGVLPRMPIYRWDGRAALRRKLTLSFLQKLQVHLWQNFSRVTRITKSRPLTG